MWSRSGERRGWAGVVNLLTRGKQKGVAVSDMTAELEHKQAN